MPTNLNKQSLYYANSAAYGGTAHPLATYLTVLTDTADKTSGQTYTFNSVNIGTEHANRVIVLSSQAQYSAVTVNGVSLAQDATATFFWTGVVATGTSVTIVLTTNASTNRALVHLWAVYPSSSTAIDVGTSTVGGLGAATISDLDVVTGGFVCADVTQASGTSTFTYAWTGTDAITKNDTTTVESAITRSSANIACIQTSSTLDMTCTPTVSANKTLQAMSFGAP